MIGNDELLLANVQLALSLEAQIKKLEYELDVVKADIKTDMRNNDMKVFELQGYSARLTPYVAKRLDAKRLKEEKPKIYAEYTIKTETERLTLKDNDPTRAAETALK